MMNMGGYGGYGGSYDMGYADNYYNRNRCRYGCPSNSYCRLGFCECNQGLTKIAVMNPSFLTFYMCPLDMICIFRVFATQ